MARSAVDTQIPPKWVVRVIAAIAFVLGLILMYLAAINISSFEWWFTAGVFLTGFTTTGASAVSLYSGNPEWLLIHLIIPG